MFVKLVPYLFYLPLGMKAYFNFWLKMCAHDSFFLSFPFFLTFPACDIPFSSGIFDLSLCKLAFLEIYSEQVLILNLGYILLKSSAINRLVLSMMINFVRLKNSAHFSSKIWSSYVGKSLERTISINHGNKM